jgi:HEAT repeat protein
MSSAGSVSFRTIGVLALVGVCFMAAGYMALNLDTTGKRIRANQRLTELGDRLKKDPNDKQALAELIAALDSRYQFERPGAAVMLGQVGRGSLAPEVVPALSRAVTNENGFLSREAALALKGIGNGATGAVPYLVVALKKGNCDTAWFSAQALGGMRVESEPVIPALSACLDVSVGDQLAREAALALAQYGSQARQALPSLRVRLASANADLKVHLAYAIRAIDPDDAESLRVLTGFINDPAMSSRVLVALERIGTNARPAIPAVAAYLERESNEVARAEALLVLQRLAGTNSPSH